ncbi:MAG: hypothetical protein ACOVMM_01230 [Chitinophagaceae bacterium]
MIKESAVTMEKASSTFKRIMIKVLIILLLVAMIFVYWQYYNVYSEGERTGVLYKFSKKGNLFKTYEGEMMIGNISGGSTGLVNEKFYFSVKDKTIADTLMKIQGQRVSLQYKQYRKPLFWNGDSEYFVIGYSKVNN